MSEQNRYKMKGDYWVIHEGFQQHPEYVRRLKEAADKTVSIAENVDSHLPDCACFIGFLILDLQAIQKAIRSTHKHELEFGPKDLNAPDNEKL